MAFVQALANRLNPAKSQQLPDLNEWPPPAHRDRIDLYAKYRAIFAGNHERALAEFYQKDYDLYIPCNLGRLITTRVTQLVWGEPVALEFPDETPDEAQDVVNEIWQRSNLQTLGRESMDDTSVAGDGIYVINRNEAQEATITAAQPEHWYPELHPDNTREVIGHRIAWVKTVRTKKAGASEDSHFLRVIEHGKGHIFNKLFVLKDGKVKNEVAHGGPEWVAVFGDDRALWPEARIDHEVTDDFLVVHVPNFRTARQFYGDSDYAGGLLQLYAALDISMSDAHKILKKHSDPKLIIPEGVMDWLVGKYGTKVDWQEVWGRLNIVAQQASAAGDKNIGEPHYLTWDAKLDALFEMIDKLTDAILMQSGVDRQLVGKGEFGTLSGRALQVLFRGTLATANSKWEYQSQAIEKAIGLAQRLQGVKEPVKVRLVKSDGLPMDSLESIQAAREQVDAGFSSRKRESMSLNDLDEKGWEKIQREISEEESTATDPGLTQKMERRTPIAVSIGREALE